MGLKAKKIIELNFEDFMYDNNNSTLLNQRWFTIKEMKQAFELGLNNGSKENFKQLIKSSGFILNKPHFSCK